MSDAKAFDLNRREHERKDAGVSATVTVGDAVCKCTVEDISPGGAKVIASVDLSQGRNIVLNLEPFGEISATVAWCRKGKLGLKFEGDPQVIAELVMSLAMQGN